MKQVLTDPLFYIFLVYGISFLLMSFVVFQGTRNAASTDFVNAFYVLAGFGLFHGITELLDWLSFVLETSGYGEFKVLIILSQTCLITSFVLLLQFGVALLTYRSKRRVIYRSLPSLLFAAYIAYLLFAGIYHMREAGLIARRTFGFSGSVLSGLAFFILAHSMKATGHDRITSGLVVTGVAFLSYAVFGGLIVEPIAELPVQLFRTVCAFTIALSSFSILEFFKMRE